MTVGYKNPPSITESREVAAAFEAKVMILEEWGLRGVPENILLRSTSDGSFKAEDLPLDRAKLRRWRGPNGDLRIWKDPLIDKPETGKHPKLAQRFKAAVNNIEKWLANKKGRFAALETEVEVLRGENDRLRAQNMALLGEIQQLSEDLAQAKAREAVPRR